MEIKDRLAILVMTRTNAKRESESLTRKYEKIDKDILELVHREYGLWCGRSFSIDELGDLRPGHIGYRFGDRADVVSISWYIDDGGILRGYVRMALGGRRFGVDIFKLIERMKGASDE
jgi:hypothetical protein